MSRTERFTIEQFTPELRAQMEPFTRAWVAERLSTERADRNAVEDGIRRCYEAAGIPWHGNVVWVDSPVVACIAGPMASNVLNDGAVDSAVHGAVDGAVYGAVHDAWFHYMSPYWSWWSARSAFCIDVLGVALEFKERSHALRAASGASLWWPHTRFTIVADRPLIIERERVAPDGWESHRLHCATGPAMAWPDGWSIHAWHGTRVPAWVIECPTVERIAAETNTEVRRCAIESYGWGRYIDDIGATPIDVAADPANPGHVLRLYDVPGDLYDGDVRLLVMDNASRDRDGSRRTFAETVPADVTSAIDAAAWQFDVDPTIYRQLERAT